MKKFKIILPVMVFMLLLGTAYWFAQETPSTQLIPYRKGAQWGYCDKNKKIVIPLKYEGAWPFHEGVASVEHNDKRGYVDKTGKEITELKL